jgi:hypothetical protein
MKHSERSYSSSRHVSVLEADGIGFRKQIAFPAKKPVG